MNTKKVLFGLMALAFLAMTAVSTTVIDEDVFEQETSIKKKKQVRF